MEQDINPWSKNAKILKAVQARKAKKQQIFFYMYKRTPQKEDKYPQKVAKGFPFSGPGSFC